MESSLLYQRVCRRSRYRVGFIAGIAALLATGSSFTSAFGQAGSTNEEREPNTVAQRANEPQPPPNRAPAQATPEQARAARTQELLDKLDPAVQNRLLGADVQIEFVGGQIILKGPEDAVQTLELLLRSLDQEIEFPEFRVIQVTERDAKEIARTAQEALRKVFTTNVQRPEEEITITALSSNILLVSAPTKQIDFVVEIIEQIDSIPDPLGKVELMTFDVKHRRASDVATELEGAISKIIVAAGGQKEKSKIQIIPNDANNTIAVTARETERPKIQALIDTLDVEPKKGWGEVRLTVYPLLHSKAKDLSEVIKNLLSAPQQASVSPTGGRPSGGGAGQAGKTQEVIYRLTISKATPSGEMQELPPIDLQKPLKILSDDGTNSLVVATVEENVGPIGELIRLMDGVPLGEEMDIRLYPLRYADAESAKELLDKMFEQGKKLNEDPDGSGKEAVPPGNVGKSLVYNINVTTEARINTLIISGRADQLALVEKVINDLDRPATSLKFPLRLLPLKHADATRLAEIITDLIDKRIESAEKTGAQKNALERERVYLTVDIRSNSLIVSASEDNHNEIVKIAEQLDKPSSSTYDQIRIVKCQRLQAKDIKDKLDELWARKTSLRTARELIEDKPVIAFDERSNLLIVASSVEDFDEIQRLVVALESQPSPHDTRLFKLEYADAAVLADMLDKLFEGIKGQFESFQTPTILPDARSNALVVAASPDGMARVEELVKRLDVTAGPMTSVFKVYPLTFAAAGKLAPRMQEVFDTRSQEQDTKRTPIVVLAEESSNSIVVSASRDDHEAVVDLLGLLDRASSIAKQFRIFPMKMAKAATVAERLETLFKAQGDASTGRADAIAVQADERTNSLIVWASPSEMENINDVVNRLDTATPAVEMMVRVIQLKQALATDFAKLFTDTLIGAEGGEEGDKAVIVSFMEKRPDGTEALRKLLRQDIRVQPDPRTNSLMVMAPADSMLMLEAMIRDFDRIRPVTSEIRLFPLINSDAETMVTKLTELFSGEGATGTTGGEGQTQTQLVFGDILGDLQLASVGQELRFASDPRTNTLIVAGAEVYLRMVEELVRYLDSQEAEDRVTEVYKVRYRDATEVASTVKNFFQQEQDVLGEAGDEESQLRRQERQVSIESLGTAEEGSSQLVVGTSRRAYQRTMQVIQELDRPEPQVMISVLIAEVTLNDDVELGVEIAGQDLTFTEGAILGPNGVLQGSDFDWVTGTDLGAAGLGLGGFNFTVTGEDFGFLVHALQQDSRLEVLSRPILLVRNGQEGKITIADQVPFVESSQLNDTGSTNSSIGREEVGIILTATPHISPDGYVTIKLKQELSNFAGENVQLTEGVSSPIFQTREVDTNVTIRDGETVVIGGLITTRESEAENKIPLIGDIPVLGALFRTTSVSKTKTELLVVLTVDILRSDEDMHNMSVEQRDKFLLPDSIRQSPLMEGLRIKPEDKAMGPVSREGSTPRSPAGATPADQSPKPQYGPKPRTYGPVVTPPASTSTASAAAFGPMLPTPALNENVKP